MMERVLPCPLKIAVSGSGKRLPRHSNEPRDLRTGQEQAWDDVGGRGVDGTLDLFRKIHERANHLLLIPLPYLYSNWNMDFTPQPNTYQRDKYHLNHLPCKKPQFCKEIKHKSSPFSLYCNCLEITILLLIITS